MGRSNHLYRLKAHALYPYVLWNIYMTTEDSLDEPKRKPKPTSEVAKMIAIMQAHRHEMRMRQKKKEEEEEE